jgi:S-adenosylmethionine synthetase
MIKDYFFTSESVSEGHPDKVADQVSDAILDAYFTHDPQARVAAETLVTTDRMIVSGEISSSVHLHDEIELLVRKVVEDIGYTHPDIGFDARTFKFHNFLHEQALEIGHAVSTGGAGDQGLMFGYACTEMPELMPLPIMLSHRIMQRHASVRKNGSLPWIRPDAKSQVTIEYRDGKPFAVRKIVVSTQHGPEVSQAVIREAVVEEVIRPVLPAQFLNGEIDYLINPSGSFVIGGPNGDTGLTGRKIIVDTYGGSCPHGGGAFSGKDPTKVDRSAAYAARYLAKNIVAAGLAEKCQVQVSYAIGKAEPLSFMLDFMGTGKVREDQARKALEDLFDLTPAGIIGRLDLRRPIYRKTTNYGHFGRELPEFSWERTDIAEAIKSQF